MKQRPVFLGPFRAYTRCFNCLCDFEWYAKAMMEVIHKHRDKVTPRQAKACIDYYEDLWFTAWNWKYDLTPKDAEVTRPQED